MQNYIFVEKQPLINPKTYFYLANGQIIKSITELPEIIERINPTIFNSHVSPYKNDFAKWIYDVYANEQLSKLLGSIKSQEETVRILRAYLKQKNNEEIQKEDLKKDETKKGEIYSENIYSNNTPNKTDDSNKIDMPNKTKGNIFIKTAQEQIAVEIQKKPDYTIQQPEEKQTVSFGSSAISITQQQATSPQIRKIYTWKTSESMGWVAKGQRKQEEQKSQQTIPEKTVETQIVKKQELKKAENIEIKQEEPKVVSQASQDIKIKVAQPETSPVIKLKVQSEEIKSQTNADEYFIQNPVTMGQLIDAKKKTLTIEPLEMISYSDRDAPNLLIEQFKETYSKAYQRMVYLRKSGFDTSLVELMIQRIPSKIKILDSSKELKDAIVIRRYLNETIEELNNVK